MAERDLVHIVFETEPGPFRLFINGREHKPGERILYELPDDEPFLGPFWLDLYLNPPTGEPRTIRVAGNDWGPFERSIEWRVGLSLRDMYVSHWREATSAADAVGQ